MCTLYSELSINTFTGYKIAVRTGNKKNNFKYYSPAMGIEYKQNSDVAIPKEQHLLVNFFDGDILSTNKAAFNVKMIGRTAVFVMKSKAKDFLQEMNGYMIEKENNGFFISKNNFPKLVLLEMTISKDLVDGSYSSPVIAGKHIDSFKEIR